MHSRKLESILRSVSRSFFISIWLLPRKLREPAGLGYLLARATDTLVDTAEISAPLREEALSAVVWAIQGTASREEIINLLNSFTPLQTNEAERLAR